MKNIFEVCSMLTGVVLIVIIVMALLAKPWQIQNVIVPDFCKLDTTKYIIIKEQKVENDILCPGVQIKKVYYKKRNENTIQP